jgi:hypothetical protein
MSYQHHKIFKELCSRPLRMCAVQKIVVTVVPVWQSSQSDTIIQSTQFSRVEMEWINDGLLICGKTREKERTLSLFLSLSRSLSISLTHTHTHIISLTHKFLSYMNGCLPVSLLSTYCFIPSNMIRLLHI